MEIYKCRLCYKIFANGRALGGHMRSHKFSIYEEEERMSQLSYETESDVVTSSSENPTMEDPKFAFTCSSLLDDDECETESSIDIHNLTRKRSKRTRKLESLKKVKTSQLCYKTELEIETQHSSASDTTTEEDLAFCLMMLSRDKWKKKKKTNKEEIDTEESSKKNRYKCDTCGKVFKSYQALGGHRASHKKIKTETEQDNVVTVSVPEKRIHECPICLRVFQSGQALGGHKRSHGIGNHQVHRIEKMIDLNLPAPTEEDRCFNEC